MKKVLVLGCTGSIGTNSLDIIENEKEFTLCGLQAHSSEKKLLELGQKFNCPTLLTSKIKDSNAFQDFLDKTKPDIVVNGIAGSAGLLPSKIVLENGIDIALANKETIVMAGPLIKECAKKHKANILPVDSEHSAIFCLLNQLGKENLDKIIITASGGPFRNYSKEELKNISVEKALNHPTWKMGKKITIDSSTLANKGLEVIEAMYLFDTDISNIEVIVHPQSIVHSLVRSKDGMLYAQISKPDMKHPIINALYWPENRYNYLKKFDLFDKELTFFKPRFDDFPLLQYAYDSAKLGNTHTIVFNAANEIAVNAFLDKKISYQDIAKIVKEVLVKDWKDLPKSFEEVFEIDNQARNYAKELI
ncbi:MAG: 1-deoxy-D-xylulose-5-phosphate reductoisomerase [Treponema sp.]|nr:1-deoxy-D-xylulose-5-phosphate reductoisomerase [Treponema sp.]